MMHTAFVLGTFADIGYRKHDLATNHTRAGSNPSTKGKVIMGDKSPKSVHKQASQKQVKASADAQRKKQAAAKTAVVKK